MLYFSFTNLTTLHLCVSRLKINVELVQQPTHVISMVSAEQFSIFFNPLSKTQAPCCTCSGVRLPGVSLAALIVRLPRSQAFYNLEAPSLFSPNVVNLHGCFTFCCKVQVLLGQMCPQLPDLELETIGLKRHGKREKSSRLEQRK